jgi:hypothetical protein
MPYTGPLSPSGLGTVSATFGPTGWTTPVNARTANNVYTTCSNTVASTSTLLKATDFGFTIPSTSDIRGIQVEIERVSNLSTGVRNIKDSGVYLIKNDVILTAVNKADTGTNWPTTEAGRLYGASGVDLWGTNWTPADINASGFGCGLTIQITANTTVTASVDKIGIIVFWSQRNRPEVIFQSQIFDPKLLEYEEVCNGYSTMELL